MKILKFHTAIFLILFLFLFLFVFTACSDEPESVNTNMTESDTETANTEITAAPENVKQPDSADIPESNFEGHNFIILVRDSFLDSRIYLNYNVTEESGDLINDAIYRRNRGAEELLNIEISQLPATDPKATITSAILADDKMCDIVVANLNELSALAASGYLLNFYDVPYIDLDKSYWDDNLTRELSVNNKLYFQTGEFTVQDDMRTACLIFNKELWGKYNLDDPYEMVKQGTWTFDTYFTNCVDITNDTNGDGILDENDLWGIMSEKSGGNFFYFASGEKMVRNNSDGIPELALSGTRVADVVDKVMTININPKVMVYDNLLQTDAYLKASQMFQNDLVLIRTAVFEPIPRDMRAMDTDFGVLPMPKYDEEQTDYYNVVLADSHGISIPVSNPDPERCGIILEYLAYSSVDTLKYAFYDVSVNGKYLRDEESLEMLDIIFGSKVYDFGFYYNISDFANLFRNMVGNGNNNFVSQYETIRSSAQGNLDKIVEQYMEIE